MLADLNNSGIAPPDPDRLDDPKHWREKASEAYFMALVMNDTTAKESMLDVAAAYEQLAQAAEDRLKPA